TSHYRPAVERPGPQPSIASPGPPPPLSRAVTNLRFGRLAPGSGARGGRGHRGGRGGAAAGPALALTADAEASLPPILEEVHRQLTADKRRAIQDRTAKHTEANQKARVEAIMQAVEAKRSGWD